MKKKLLFIWDYERTDLTDPLKKLENDFDLFFLYNYEKNNHERRDDLAILYWNDFKTPLQVIDSVKPDRIIFGDIETFHEVALNITATHLNIETIILDHGIRYNLKSYLITESKKKNAPPEIPKETKQKQRKNTLRFYLASLRYVRLREFPTFFTFAFRRLRNGINQTQAACPFNIRFPAKYFLMYSVNKKYYLERDGEAIRNRLFYSGDIFHEFENTIPEKPVDRYYLLLDAFDVGNKNFDIPEEDKISFITKVNEYAKKRQCKLKIKLHPRNYNCNYFPEDENIIYLRNCRIISEVGNSEGCIFNSFSTLFPICIYYKPCILFFSTHKYIYEDLVDLKTFAFLNMHDFKIGDISFLNNEDKRKEYAEKVIGAKPGNNLPNLIDLLK